MRQLCATQTCAKTLRFRDRHRRARPIICALFWAITSSLCVSISLFLSPPLSLPYNRTDFGQYISARIVFRVPILDFKKLPKDKKSSLFGVFSFSSLSTTDFCFLSFDDINKGKKMATNSKVSKNSWRTQYTLYSLATIFVHGEGITLLLKGKAKVSLLAELLFNSPCDGFFCFPWGSPEPQSFGPNFAFFREALAIR